MVRQENGAHLVKSDSIYTIKTMVYLLYSFIRTEKSLEDYSIHPASDTEFYQIKGPL